jgi:CRISPR-associated protein Cas2
MNSAGAGQHREPARYLGDENLYIVAYDIASPRRWRKVFRIMEGYGEWVQLSVFQCRLTRRRQIELKQALDEVINHAEDHVIIIDVGLAAINRPRIESLGKPFSMVDRGPVIV